MSAESPTDPKVALEYYRIQQRYSTARTAIRVIGWAFAAYVGFAAFARFAGQTTAVAISLSTVRDFEKGRREPIPNNLTAMKAALELAGVSFVDTSGITYTKRVKRR